MRPLRRFLPLKLKLWLRRVARRIVGIDGSEESSAHAILLDQKIEQSYSLIDFKCEETRSAIEKIIEVHSQLMEQRIAQLERRVMAIESVHDRASNTTLSENEP